VLNTSFADFFFSVETFRKIQLGIVITATSVLGRIMGENNRTVTLIIHSYPEIKKDADKYKNQDNRTPL